MRKSILILISAAAALVACNKTEVTSPSQAGFDETRVVKFNVSSLYNFDTKAAGDAIGTDNTNNKVIVYAGCPIASAWDSPSFGRYEVGSISDNEGSLTGTTLLWGIGQGSTTSNFFAFYPVTSDGTLTWTSDSGSTESDLYMSYEITGDARYAINTLVAKTSAAPGTTTTPASVSLSFSHPFTLLQYNITNSTDDVIKKVELWGFYNTGKIGYTTGIVDKSSVSNLTTSSSGKVEMLVASGTGAASGAITTYQAAIMPCTSTCTPTILITMYSGKTYEYALSSAQAFDAASQYIASITLSVTHSEVTNNRTAAFSFSVPSTWTTPGTNATPSVGDATSSGETKWWYLEGTIGTSTAGNWINHLPLTCTGENTWQIVGFKYDNTIGDNPGVKFRFVADPSSTDWDVNYGVQDGSGNKMSLELSSSKTSYGSNFTLNSGQPALMLGDSGTYSLTWNSSTHTITSATRTEN